MKPRRRAAGPASGGIEGVAREASRSHPPATILTKGRYRPFSQDRWRKGVTGRARRAVRAAPRCRRSGGRGLLGGGGLGGRLGRLGPCAVGGPGLGGPGLGLRALLLGLAGRGLLRPLLV